MKKIIFYLCLLLLLYLISIIPTSGGVVNALEINTCTRSESDLHVRNEFIRGNISSILNTPCVSELEKVYDFADLLTDSEEETLYHEVENFIEYTNYDIALVTVNENNKGSAMVYADDFYDYNAFGKNATRDGLLLLIDMDTRNVYISTTGYAIKMYDAERLGTEEEFYNTDTVIDAGYSYIKNGEYYNAFSKMIAKLRSFYELGYPKSNANIEISEIGEPIIIRHINYSFIGIISIIISSIIAIVFYNISRLKIKVGSTANYMQTKNITTKKDLFVNSVVTHTLRNTDSGGSSGSGGSYHSSSSGSFHGGGGRGF